MIIIGHQLTDVALNFFDDIVLMDVSGKTILSCPMKDVEQVLESLNFSFPDT